MPAKGAGGNSPARAEPADVIGRCQVHKLRNVRDHLPEEMRGAGDQADARPYHAGSALEAEASTLLRPGRQPLEGNLFAALRREQISR